MAHQHSVEMTSQHWSMEPTSDNRPLCAARIERCPSASPIKTYRLWGIEDSTYHHHRSSSCSGSKHFEADVRSRTSLILSQTIEQAIPKRCLQIPSKINSVISPSGHPILAGRQSIQPQNQEFGRLTRLQDS
jgi:hypothetical protein